MLGTASRSVKNKECKVKAFNSILQNSISAVPIKNEKEAPSPAHFARDFPSLLFFVLRLKILLQKIFSRQAHC